MGDVAGAEESSRVSDPAGWAPGRPAGLDGPTLLSGERLPAIGQGTWGFGASRRDRHREVEALRLGFSLGMTLVDTAEVYAAGESESVVGEAIRDCREQVFVVTKVWPSHAQRDDVLISVHESLQRLRTDYIDLVLLHWPTRSVRLQETMAALNNLRTQGLIRRVGVSNFDADWLRRAVAASEPGAAPVVDQVPYSLIDRRAEAQVLPACRAGGQVVMAYSPFGHRGVDAWTRSNVLAAVARERGVSPSQVALNWLICQPGVVPIPKAARPEHVRDNAAAAAWRLTANEVARLGAAFPPRAGSIPKLPQKNWFFELAWSYVGFAQRLRNRGG
jgi:diketogulonate reductase-like aldo/keto reductase